MGGGARYPYPKEVYSPSGGWWTRPKNWRMNTFIVGMGILVITYGTFRVSADKEWRYIQPGRHIPSMMWTRQYTVPDAKPPNILDRLKDSSTHTGT